MSAVIITIAALFLIIQSGEGDRMSRWSYALAILIGCGAIFIATTCAINIIDSVRGAI